MKHNEENRYQAIKRTSMIQRYFHDVWGFSCKCISEIKILRYLAQERKATLSKFPYSVKLFWGRYFHRCRIGIGYPNENNTLWFLAVCTNLVPRPTTSSKNKVGSLSSMRAKGTHEVCQRRQFTLWLVCVRLSLCAVSMKQCHHNYVNYDVNRLTKLGSGVFCSQLCWDKVN